MKELTQQQIKSLPTLADVVKRIKNSIHQQVASGLWTGLCGGYTDVAWNLPDGEFCNNADDDKFIVVQTEKRRHTLKPNLKNSPYIFRGQNKPFPRIISSFERDNYDKEGKPIDPKIAHAKHLAANLKTEEFCELLRTHPLFMMFDRGIALAPEKRPLFLNMNYYGLAQHYGFKTAVLDFTNDIDVAAFFACTKCIGYDKYAPITDTKQNPYGVIYVHEIKPMLTFKGFGFSTIGLQLYPRSGAQKGLLYNEVETSKPIEELIDKPICFRHEPLVSRHFYNKMIGRLFPSDGISQYAEELLRSNEISGKTFMQNLYTNQENMGENLLELESQGISVNWGKQHYFTKDLLAKLDEELKNGLWEHFCNQIYFADDEIGKAMHDSLLMLPKNPTYAHYFKMEEYERITAYEADGHKRANVKFALFV